MWAKLSASVKRLKTTRLARHFVRQQSGVAAVEFGMVAAPFLALIFAILETSVIFFAGQALETAVADSGRLIMTGQAQQQGFDQNAFKNAVCAKIYGLFNCAGGIAIEVKSFPTFAAITSPPPTIDANGNIVNNFGYDPGNPCSIVLVRLFYQWPVYVSLLGVDSLGTAGKRTLVATSAFRNEPYGTSGC